MVSMLTVCIKCRDFDCDVDSCCNKCNVCVDGFMAAYVKHRSILEAWHCFRTFLSAFSHKKIKQGGT